MPSHAAELAVLPWQLIGWDAEFPRRHAQTLDALHKQLGELWTQKPESLDAWHKSRNESEPLNQARRSRQILIGEARDPFSEPLYLVPILCPLAEYTVLALQVVDLKRQLILGGTQTLLPRDNWELRARKKPELAQLQSSLSVFHEQLSPQVQQRQTQIAQDALKLRLNLMRGSQNSRIGAHRCLNLVLENSLLNEQQMIPNIGNMEAALLRDAMKWSEGPQRATRLLTIDWGQAQPEGAQSFSYHARWSEGVLAGGIDPQLQGNLPLQKDQARFTAPPELLELLKKERETLMLSDLPEIIRRDRAWVYLDRGRAYGLDMDDRLYLDDGTRLIKGHVVGFFGPKLGLTTPSGKPVHEGAIVYVRKGQRDVRIGDKLRFDPTKFPTPWPPVRQPARASSL